MAHGTKCINHTQFADDTILLGGESLHIARRFKNEMDNYFQASYNKLNLRKSLIYSWNVNSREMTKISRIMGIEGVTNWESFNYLGFPLFKSNPKTTDLNPLIEKIKKKILAWGAIWLNLAGKMVMIKLVLNGYPLYRCSMMLDPNGMLTKIEGLLKNFL